MQVLTNLWVVDPVSEVAFFLPIRGHPSSERTPAVTVDCVTWKLRKNILRMIILSVGKFNNNNTYVCPAFHQAKVLFSFQAKVLFFHYADFRISASAQRYNMV